MQEILEKPKEIPSPSSGLCVFLVLKNLFFKGYWYDFLEKKIKPQVSCDLSTKENE